MKKYLLLAIIGMSFIPLKLEVKQIVDRLTSYSLTHPQEKIFVHFDKPLYSLGETIWFKAYLVEALSNKPAALSNVLHIELLDSEMNELDRKILKIENGGVAGDFLLQDTLTSGTYHVRAYTNWMQNYDPEFYFRQSLKVQDSREEEVSESIGRKLLVDFFPEGGDLIQGIASIVAIKATDQYGKGIEVTGKIFDESGEEITAIETDIAGMGDIIITPKSDAIYRAKLEYNGEILEYRLPEVRKSGYALRAINNYQSDKITIAVTAKDALLENSGLVVHRNGEVFYSVVNNGNEESFSVNLLRKNFPSGICHITFFDPKGQPQAERLIYANYPQSKEVSLLKEESYLTRSKVELGFEVKDSSRIDCSNLSISITPRELVKYSDNNSNIMNYLMLTSDLVGWVEEPGRYLIDDRYSFKSLDLLMRTQGWRRFDWQDVLNFDGESTPNLWAEDGITFSGQVVDYFRREKPRDSKISLSVIGDKFGFIEGETDEEGRFLFTGIDLYDSSNLVFHAQRKLKRDDKFRNDVFIDLDEKNTPEIQKTKFNYNLFYQTQETKAYKDQWEKIERLDSTFNFDKDAILLKEVEVTGVNEKRNDPFESHFKIYTTPTVRLVADSILKRSPISNIFDLLRRMSRVNVYGSFPNQSIEIGGRGSVDPTPPLIVLDGVYVNVDVLNSIPPISVSHIDVLTYSDAVIYGAQGANGVIAVYTKVGLGVEEKSLKNLGILNQSHPGYSKAREFFSPSYDVPKDVHVKPDIRTTLYWNPTILVEGDSTSEVSFYTSDQIGFFDIIIQGIATDGTPLFLKDSLIVE